MKFKNTLLYCGLSREEYYGISSLIDERNFSSCNIFSVAMIVFGAIFLLSALLSGSSTLFPYIFLIVTGAVFFLIRQFVLKKADRYTLLLRYLQLCTVFIFAIILSAQPYNRRESSVSIMVFLALLPLTINDRPIRMFSVVSFFSLCHIVCASQVKVPDAFRSDWMNTLTFSILGMAVYLLMSNRNVHEIFLRQKVAESERLREEKRAVEMANAAKSDFLANMSHEIRTPINAVLGMNEMVIRESLSGLEALDAEPETARSAFNSIRTFAGDIRSAGNNLLSIINDILDFSKIESGKMDIVEGPYKISSVLNDVSNMFFFRAQEKGLSFVVDVDKSLPDALYGDEVRIRQIITNLLGNAVKYTKQGGVRLDVGQKELPSESGERKLALVISVRDTGIGIKEEDLEKLYNKFERVDLKQNSTIEGTGLGLAITHNLLDLMGGSIHVESVYGEGSTFTVSIPQKVLSPEPVGDFREKFEKNTQKTKAYREFFHAPDAQILVVDDTRMNLTVVVGLLKKTQIRIDTAGSGDEAIELAGRKRYDLILMDQRMPKMDGTEAMRHIKARTDSLNRDTPFICLTADALSGARERYIGEGFTDYLTKPIDSIALEQMLVKYLPEEKVTPVRREAQEPAQTDAGEPAADRFDALRHAGVSPEIGLQHCQDDEQFYASLLREFANGAEEKADTLDKLYAARNWKEYGVVIHAIKSTSKMLGAPGLSEVAAHLEAAANGEDAARVKAGHRDALALLRSAADAIRRTYPEEEAPDSGEILEFMPED